MDSGWWQAVFAGAAALIACVAAWHSSRQAAEAREQANQAKRQADAAHGDVRPTFHIEQLNTNTAIENCRIVCRNFNRHALVLREIRIHHPADVVLIPKSPSVRDAISSAEMELALNRDDLFVSKPNLNLEGVAPGRDPSEYKQDIRATCAARVDAVSRYALQFSDIKPGRVVDLTYEVDFELLDGSGKGDTEPGRANLRF